MVERIKNKKGFTIIEIMVVIALIGILAAVLVPKFGGVKDTARNAGMLTNVKMAEAYVASIIDSYKTSSATAAADLQEAIEDHFVDDAALVNPYTADEDSSIKVTLSGTGVDGAFKDGTGVVADGGIVYVVIDTDKLNTYIDGFDSKGNVIEATKREIER